MSTLKTLAEPIHVIRVGCHTCRRYHDIRVPCTDYTGLLREFQSWAQKHPGHHMPEPVMLKREIPRDFETSEFDQAGDAPWWMPDSGKGFTENANFQVAYASGGTFTLTSWATLASDSNLLAGASTAVLDISAGGLCLDVGISCQIKNGTTPTTAKQILVYGWSLLADGSTYPDAITGSDAAITITNSDAVNNMLRVAWAFASTTTTGSTYPTGWHTGGLRSVLNLFGRLPAKFGLWIVHDSVAAFASGSTANYNYLYVVG